MKLARQLEAGMEKELERGSPDPQRIELVGTIRKFPTPSLSQRAAALESRAPSHSARERGSVLIIVMWVAFGLVSIALYFAQSMTFELRASDNRVASLEAEQAVEGASRYVNYVLTTFATNGAVPDLLYYRREAVPVGEAKFWLIGRDGRQDTTAATQPFFGLVDEASKLNLNTATSNMLQALPGMTPELAAAIIDWRDPDTTVSQGGAESEIYQRRQPAYTCKNAPFETVEELRLVYGMTLDILRSEDSNQNGVLDANENDGPTSLPNDDRDGQMDAGILEYVTVYSRQPNTRSDGSARLNISNPQQQQALAALLRETLGYNQSKATQVSGIGVGSRSALEFYFRVREQMTAEEFAQIENSITVVNGGYIDGLINVNTASAKVLECIPGVGTDKAPSLVSYRQSNAGSLNSIAWVAEVLDQNSARQAGPYLTAQSYQFTADIAAVGHHDRGYSRARFVFDTSEGTPKIRYRQDLARLGWALGQTARQKLLLAKETR